MKEWLKHWFLPWITAVVVTGIVTTVLAQDGKVNPTYKPTEIQLLRLQVVQKDAQLLKAQLQDIQRQFADKVGELQRTADKVKQENNWPPETKFDFDSLQFSAPSKEEKKP